MIVAKITIDQAERAAYLLQTEGGHDEAADALLALTNDTDILMTSDGAGDAEAVRLVSAAPDMLAALKAISDNPRVMGTMLRPQDAEAIRSAIAKAGG